MPSLLDPAAREDLLRRLRGLQPTARPRWGTLDAPRMVCHLADSLRVGLGDRASARRDTLARRTLLKWLVVYTPVQPPPGRILTSPEMLATAPSSWAEDVAAVAELVLRMASTPTAAVHPFFGPLTPGGWCRLSWKHLDHHLRQFGA
jgi:hypothetical protein